MLTIIVIAGSHVFLESTTLKTQSLCVWINCGVVHLNSCTIVHCSLFVLHVLFLQNSNKGQWHQQHKLLLHQSVQGNHNRSFLSGRIMITLRINACKWISDEKDQTVITWLCALLFWHLCLTYDNLKVYNLTRFVSKDVVSSKLTLSNFRFNIYDYI